MSNGSGTHHVLVSTHKGSACCHGNAGRRPVESEAGTTKGFPREVMSRLRARGLRGVGHLKGGGFQANGCPRDR